MAAASTLKAVAFLTAFTLLAFSIPVIAFAQDCAPGNITLTSQQAVDNFQVNHGPCDTVTGTLVISGADIVNVDGLSALIQVNSLRVEFNPVLLEVDGLSGLVLIEEDLYVRNNDELQELNGLAALSGTLRHLSVQYNPKLIQIDALAGIYLVAGDLNVLHNTLLVHLNGLRSVSSVGGSLTILGNLFLSHLDGLLRVAGVERDFRLQSNNLLSDCAAVSHLVDQRDDYIPGPGPGSGGVPDVGEELVVEGNAPGCDSVAEILADEPLLQINAGLNDAWFDPETDGQGFFIIVFPEIRQIFLGWFTYDTERPPDDVMAILGDPGHRWLTAQGDYEGNQALLDVWVTEGGVFDSETPRPERYMDGEILLEFMTCNSGTVSYDIPSIGRQGVIPIQRISLDNVELCSALGIQAEDAD